MQNVFEYFKWNSQRKQSEKCRHLKENKQKGIFEKFMFLKKLWQPYS